VQKQPRQWDVHSNRFKSGSRSHYRGQRRQARLNSLFGPITVLAHRMETWDGCPSEAVWKGKRRRGWQEDAHTDKFHNFVDAMNTFPEWAK